MRLAVLILCASACFGETYSYWVAPCDEKLARASGCEAADPELADWALAAWANASKGKLAFQRAADERKARIRFYWAPGSMQLYGEARPILVEGERGAEIHVRPDMAVLGPGFAEAAAKDPLFRHAIVYLTCLHESGHAIGLQHTAEFADIMYSFGFGGDIGEYFARYRRKLKKRDDISRHSGLSRADERSVRALY
ncbi:MAG: hypothetical protein IPM24_27055 [Bryobacterales bacterium]|nr:hypothetical protein [Bryobacterales bacterium]